MATPANVEERNNRRQRRGYRTQVQKVISQTDQVLSSSSPDRQHMQVMLDSLYRYASFLQEIDVTVWNTIDTEDLADADMAECNDLQEHIRMYTVKLQDTLASITTDAEVTQQSEGSIRAPSFQHRQTAKLPTLQLPRFNGNPLEWSTFWDSYESAVQKSDLSAVDKFNYLKSFLQGTASDAIAGIPVTNASYDIAVNLIKERFGQPQMIINAHVESLVNLPRSTNDTANLRLLYDLVEMHVRGLATLGITAETTAGQVMTPIILTKLPEEIRLILTRKHGTAVGDLTKLRELLRTEVEARELSRSTTIADSTCTAKEPNFSTGALVTQSSLIICVFCKGKNHSALTCRKIIHPSDRRSILQQESRCYNCLKQGHSYSRCTDTTSCRQCDGRHHTSICYKGSSSRLQRTQNSRTQRQSFTPRQPVMNEPSYSNWQKSRRTTTAVVAENTDTEADLRNQSSTLVTTSSSNVILMQTALAKTKDAMGNEHTVRLLFDTASQRSYVTAELVKKLGLPSSKSENLCVSGFGQNHASAKRYNVMTIIFNSRFSDAKYPISTLVVPQITQPIYRSPIDRNGHSFITTMQLADPPQTSEWISVDVLVGLDHYWEFVHGQITRIPGTELSAVESLFGFLISGKNGASSHPSVNTFFIHTENSDDSLKRFWDSETFEACESEDDKDPDNPVLRDFDNSIRKVDDRYEVRFPWKKDESALPSNFKLCMNRFQGLIARLQKNDLVTKYSKVIQQQLDLGFIEPVNCDEIPVGPLHYIPHHPVIKNDCATTKLRIVYDASARLSSCHPSLNDCLHSGPNLLADIHRMLILFRTHPIVLLADIEKAFLQVGLSPKDRDATRFFWLKNLSLPATVDNIVVYRFCRVLFGATCSPFLLAATLRYHLKSYTDPSIQSMVQQFYVDNFCVGTNTIHEAHQKYKTSKAVLNDAGMNLREWLSNSSEFITKIPIEDRASATSAKFLGLQWNTSTDMIYLKDIAEAQSVVKITKRHILHTISKVYDPLGFISPFVVKAKMLIQELWKLQLDWDAEVPSSVATKWKQLTSQLVHLSEAMIPRLLPSSGQFHDLHIFVDASEKAYGAVAYLRSTTANRFVCSKSRVAPVKPITIPRLELSAFVLGCKLGDFLRNTFSSTRNVFVWSDSQIVLCWINNPPSKQPVFVRNRVSTIKTHNFNCRYCPTLDNPADLCSRGSNFDALKDNNLWWNGPAWLSEPSSRWPAIPGAIRTLQVDVEDEPVNQEPLATIVDKVATPFGISIKRFNQLEKLLKVTAACHRFIQLLQRKPCSTPTVAERDNALQLWIKWIQNISFFNERKLLTSQCNSKTIKELQLRLKDDILVSRGRFANVSGDTFNNDLILLPTHHPFTDMIIMDCHNKLQHQGLRHTLSAIRERYWVPKGRQVVRSVIKRCHVCKLWEGPSFRLPIPPPLPSSRVTKSPPFSFTGCDFAGPVYVFDNTLSSKCYICLFTCAVTRAVHLELVSDLTTPMFILALKRFVHRRGVPVQMISDNAKTFKLAKSVLERMCHNIIQSPDCTNFAVLVGIDWRFNIERAPWWGGFFERMVGLVKRTLIKIAGKTKLNSVQLSTILTEIESILNSRPLTYVYSEKDSGQPLTPNNFLVPSKRIFLPHQTVDPDPDFNEDSTTVLLSKLQFTEQLLDYYWTIWRQEYLSLLREHHQQSLKRHTNSSSVPAVGDVVLIREDGLKRGQWKMGIIEKTFMNKDDGFIRSAQVKTATSSLNRPIALLYPLEIKTCQNRNPIHVPPTVSEERPQRKAGIKAKQTIQSYFKDQDKDT